MPGLSGIDLIKRIKLEKPKLRILVLSMHGEQQYAARALKAGASGYLNKDSASELLEHLSGAIESGRAATNPAMTQKPRSASRSGGTVDAPRKAHRKRAPTARGTKHSDQTVAKIKGAKTMRRGHRRG